MPLLRRLLICTATRRWAETWAAVYELGYQAGRYDAEHQRASTCMRVVNDGG